MVKIEQKPRSTSITKSHDSLSTYSLPYLSLLNPFRIKKWSIVCDFVKSLIGFPFTLGHIDYHE